MLTYKGKVLIKFKDKKGGKNQSDVDGFYRNENGFEFFIKKPNDPKELFTELFAGLLLHEFKQRGLIDKIYHDSLICADLIQFEDGSYGLIQPKVSFHELYKIIGTGYRDGSDRDPLFEMFCGPQYYIVLTQLKHYFGLSTALMMSLLLGDNSVHSGNVVCLELISASDMEFIQFARIDWGAALRYFGHQKNNEQLLHPFEYQGWFNPKGYTKGYFLNYKKINGLFPAIAAQASQLQSQVDKQLFIDIVTSALQLLPADLIKEHTKKELAQYLCIDSFNYVSFGKQDNEQQFALDIAQILFERLKKITVLHDLSATPLASQLSPIQYMESVPTAVALPVNLVTPFPDQLNIWLSILSSSDEKSIFDFNSIERDKLAKHFNCFMENTVRQVERLHLYANELHQHDSEEGTFLRTQFTLDTTLTPCSTELNREQFYQQSYWQITNTVVTASFYAMVTVRIIQRTENTSELSKAAAVHFLFGTFKEHLQIFNNAYKALINEIEKTLSSLSGAQLAIICFNEIEFINSSILIAIILRNPILWSRMHQYLDEPQQRPHHQEINNQLIALQQRQQDLSLFLALANEYPSTTRFHSKGVLVIELTKLFTRLPELLQSELAPTLNTIQDEYRKLQQEYTIDVEESKPKAVVETTAVTHKKTNYWFFFSQYIHDNPPPSLDEPVVISERNYG